MNQLSQGAWIHEDSAFFRVWAPRAVMVEVLTEGQGTHPLEHNAEGMWSGRVRSLRPGVRYRYQLKFADGSQQALIDPCCRFAPEGPRGWAELVGPSRFAWTDEHWQGLDEATPIIYEMHVGTFTQQGTYAAAREALPALAALGITVIELMPLGDFPGRFGWGYDGVLWFAPYHEYGRPDDLRSFVDRAHQLGIGVILDVVYNHLGPDGNVLPQYSDDYLSSHVNAWGKALNFDGPNAGPVRQMVIDNATYWIDEFRLDGLRIDATQDIKDQSSDPIIGALTRAARAAASGRRILVIGENEPQDTRLLEEGPHEGSELDALWNDDYHHAALVAMTGRRHAYFLDYRGRSAEFVAAARHGFLYQGQHYRWQKARRGHSTRGLTADRFVAFLENHDQVANTFSGIRPSHVGSRGLHRAMTAVTLLGPWMPLLLQGQEWATRTRFLYFADHEPELAERVHQGRLTFLAQFPGSATPEAIAAVPHPADPQTFERCRLDWHEREHPASLAALAMHTDLLTLRRTDPTFSMFNRRPCDADRFDASVISDNAFCYRWWGEDLSGADDRLLVVNLGPDEVPEVVPEPLLAPGRGFRWRTGWSSENARYGGTGEVAAEGADGKWHLPGQCAVLLFAERHNV